jgi:uncharacterized protein (DUF433 family)
MNITKKVASDWKVRRKNPAKPGIAEVTGSGNPFEEPADVTKDDWDRRTVGMNNQGHLLSQEEWLAERARFATIILRDCVEVNANKKGGVPVLKGTRFTIAQLFAEIADGRSIEVIADDLDLDVEMIKTLLQGFSIHLDRPMFR